MATLKMFKLGLFCLLTLLLMSIRAETLCLPCQTNEYFSEYGSQCQPCPQGLWCRGDNFVEPRTINSSWIQRDGIYLLKMCPIGYSMSSAEDGLVEAGSQQCQPCAQGQECVNPPCNACSLCRPGFYKDQMNLGSCLRCPADTYNENEGGDALETSCTKCPDQSTTNGKRGANSINDCECKSFLYPIFTQISGKNTMICQTCPTGAVCPDKTCALRHPPGWYCNQSQDSLLGDLSEWDGVKWVNVSSRVQGTAPAPRQGAGSAIIEGFLYVFGGSGSSGGQQTVG
jgi:hypothetical protein